MNVTSIKDISALLQNIVNERSTARTPGSPERREISERASDKARERLALKNKASGQPPSTTPDPLPQPDTTAPATQSPVKSSSNSDAIDELAALYVQQYQEGTGKQLSEAEFERKKADVANFYTTLSGGKERLDAIVFANDTI